MTPSPATARRYWDDRPADIEEGVHSVGRTERSIARFSPILRRMLAGDVARLRACATTAEQGEVASALCRRTGVRAVLALIFNPVSGRLLLRSRCITAKRAADGHSRPYLLDRLSTTLDQHPFDECFVLSLFLDGHLRNSRSLPIELAEDTYPIVRQRLDRVRFETSCISEYLARQPAASIDAFSLSDLGGYLTIDEFGILLDRVQRVASPDATVCIREYISTPTARAAWPDTLVRRGELERRLDRSDRSVGCTFVCAAKVARAATRQHAQRRPGVDYRSIVLRRPWSLIPAVPGDRSRDHRHHSEIAMTTWGSIAIALLASLVTLLLIVFAWWRFYFFHRNPHRTAPPGADPVCPADGTIVYVEDVALRTPRARARIASAPGVRRRRPVERDRDLPGHLRRPCRARPDRRDRPSPPHGTGRRQHLDGRVVHFHAALRRPLPIAQRGYLDKNRFLGVEIAGEIRVLLVLMADWWIDQIVPLAADGARVERGQVIGRIRMGSQVDLWTEAGVLRPIREVGERVHAGEMAIAGLAHAGVPRKKKGRLENFGVEVKLGGSARSARCAPSRPG